MSTPRNAARRSTVAPATGADAWADLVETTRRNQAAAAEALRAWTTAARTIGDATGTQASTLRRLLSNLFDLADQAVVVERELATFLAVNARVSAAALTSLRALSDAAAAALEDATRTATRVL